MVTAQRSPFNFLYVLSVPYVAAISSIAYPNSGNLHYTGYLWSLMLVIGIFLILQHRQPIWFPWKLWCPWFGYVVLSLLWGGIHWLPNLQEPAQMIAPLVVGVVASSAIQTEVQFERLMRGFVHCLFFVAAVFVFFWYGPGIPYERAGSGYSARPAAMTAAFIACLFVARVQREKLRSVLGWAACLAIVFLSGSRMATLVVLLLWLVSPLYRRIKSRLLVSGAMCLVGLALFYSPVLQERFFPSGGGSLQEVMQGDYSGSGRFDLWPIVWQEAQKHIVFGAGAGEVGRFEEKAHLSEPTPLNDYLQVVFQYGLVGLLLLVCTVLKQMQLLHRLSKAKDPAIVWASTAAYLGFFALMVFAWTENVLIYGVYFMHPLFAVAGAAIGLNATKGLQARRRNTMVRSQVASLAS
jgi:O-Antigen ligase